MTEMNWSGNYEFAAAGLHYPETVEQVQAIVAAHDRVRGLGSRHSFNAIADTVGELVSVARLPRSVTIDRDRSTATVSAGMTYGQVGLALQEAGYALRNLGSLPHISVAGACATGTHGSGVENQNLSSSVAALQVVTAAGELVEVTGPDLAGMTVGLGLFGIVTAVTLDVVPTFDIQQRVYEGLAISELDGHLDEVMSAGYSVSLFTGWGGPRIEQVWVKRIASDERWPTELFGAVPATVAQHPLPGHPADSCTEQLGITGPWFERLPHFRLDHTPSSGEELQTEYLLPRTDAVSALHAIAELGPLITDLLYVSEVRTIAADDLWLSPATGRDSLAIHFTWKKDWPAVRAILPTIERALAPFDARPHWGKLFTTEPAVVRASYPRVADFQSLVASYDPTGKFGTSFLEPYVGVR
jgi:xylitol oxidase